MALIRRTSVSRAGDQNLVILTVALAVFVLLVPWCRNDAFAQSSSERQRVVFFVGDDGEHGRELWISDGTGWGTNLVRDIRVGPESSAISELTSAGNRIFFTAVNEGGREVWVSDGTRSGTKRVKDIFPGPVGSEPSLLTPYGSDILFVADDGSRGNSIWVSDGTRSGTKLLLSRTLNKRLNKVQDLLTIGMRVYIVDEAEIVVFDTKSRQLTRVAKSDPLQTGAFAGTNLLKVNRNVVVRDELPHVLDGGNLSYIDRKLRHRDIVDIRTGVRAGTQLLSGEALPVQNRFFFEGGWGVNNVNPDGLWAWDPKLGGAYRVGFSQDEVGPIVALGRDVVCRVGFFSSSLWYSDGTEDGTHLLFGSDVQVLASAGSYAAFAKDAVLWITDGTAAGTQLVADFSTVGTDISPLVGDRGRLWFSVDYEGYGRELWTSDGTFSGTRSPGDFRPGPEGLDPDQITPAWIRDRGEPVALPLGSRNEGDAIVRDMPLPTYPGRPAAPPTPSARSPASPPA